MEHSHDAWNLDYAKLLFEKALEIAREAHKGQPDKGGTDYINHPLTVSAMIRMEPENPSLKVLVEGLSPREIQLAQITALLHDVLEDSAVTYDHLLHHAQIPYEICELVQLLTKEDGEDYDAFLERLKPNRIASTVKVADMLHNSDLTRLKDVSEKDRQRVEKYQRGIQKLVDYHGGRSRDQ